MFNSIAKIMVKAATTYMVWKSAEKIVDGYFVVVSKVKRDGVKATLDSGVKTVVKDGYMLIPDSFKA